MKIMPVLVDFPWDKSDQISVPSSTNLKSNHQSSRCPNPCPKFYIPIQVINDSSSQTLPIQTQVMDDSVTPGDFPVTPGDFPWLSPSFSARSPLTARHGAVETRRIQRGEPRSMRQEGRATTPGEPVASWWGHRFQT